MELTSVIKHYQDALDTRYGAQITPEHEQAVGAILDCRTARYGEMILNCETCEQQHHHFHSCGHRSCPRCQHHETSQWLERQYLKLLPVEYFMLTFTLPYELRYLTQQHQKTLYNALFTCASNTLNEFGINDKKLGASLGMTAVLHTHSRRLDYHPHVHVVVPGGCLDTLRRQWKKMKGKYLFNAFALAQVFRARLLHALTSAGLSLPTHLPNKWNENNIIADDGKKMTFRYVDSQTKETRTRTMKAEDFLWLLLQHVLPKGFRRVRDYGFLHGNAKKMLSLVQRMFGLFIEPLAKIYRPPFTCPTCKTAMRIIAFIRPAWRSG